jgi:hypothetical protein
VNPIDEARIGGEAVLQYETLDQFVAFLAEVYARQVADQHDTVWCPQWYRHPEAYLRFQAMYLSYEKLSRDPTTGLSVWWIQHADRHMAQLFNPRGPFKYCGVRNGHKSLVPELPVVGDDPRQGGPPDTRALEEFLDNLENGLGLAGFATLDEFVNKWLRKCYARQVRDVNDTVWCPEWWKHPEAKERLLALWRAYEEYRTRAATGISEWYTQHADQHMAKLFDPKGPFKYCSVRNGHKEGMVRPLKIEPPTAPMDVNPSRQQLEEQIRRHAERFGR